MQLQGVCLSCVPKRGDSLEDWMLPVDHHVPVLTVLRLHKGRHIRHLSTQVIGALKGDEKEALSKHWWNIIVWILFWSQRKLQWYPFQCWAITETQSAVSWEFLFPSSWLCFENVCYARHPSNGHTEINRRHIKVINRSSSLGVKIVMFILYSFMSPIHTFYDYSCLTITPNTVLEAPSHVFLLIRDTWW